MHRVIPTNTRITLEVDGITYSLNSEYSLGPLEIHDLLSRAKEILTAKANMAGPSVTFAGSGPASKPVEPQPQEPQRKAASEKIADSLKQKEEVEKDIRKGQDRKAQDELVQKELDRLIKGLKDLDQSLPKDLFGRTPIYPWYPRHPGVLGGIPGIGYWSNSNPSSESCPSTKP